MSRRPFTSPTGRRYTARQYVERVLAVRDDAGGAVCAAGHLHCALWRGGPCVQAVAATILPVCARASP